MKEMIYLMWMMVVADFVMAYAVLEEIVERCRRYV